MAVRVKLRIKTRGEKQEEVETVALVNSGFETDTPQLLVPELLAKKLNIWEKIPLEARIEGYGGVGGPIRVYVIPEALEVSILEEDIETKSIVSDAVVAEGEQEVLISDYLAGLLGIIVEDFREGLWRIREKPEVIRKTYKPQYWV